MGLERLLPKGLQARLGLLYREYTPTISLEQFQRARMLHPYLSSLEIDIHDPEERNYKLTYRSQGPVEDVPDSERNSANLEFRSVSPQSLVKSFVDRPTYERLASDISKKAVSTDASARNEERNPAQTHKITERGRDLTQVTTYQRPLTHEELVFLVGLLPGEAVDKLHLRPVYQNVRGSVYKMATQPGSQLQEVRS